MLCIPYAPVYLKDYFVSWCDDPPETCDIQHEGHGHGPIACRRAGNTVVLFSSIKSLLQNSIFSVILSPVLGHWSDVVGRKPFLVGSVQLKTCSQLSPSFV